MHVGDKNPKLEELIKAEGWTGAAARVGAEPELLGRLLGRGGLFASRSAQLDRSGATSAARSLSSSLSGIAQAERQAERDYRDSVTRQMRRDAVGVPKLSVEATAVLETVRAAASRAEQPGETWRQGERAPGWPWRGSGRRGDAIPRSLRRRPVREGGGGTPGRGWGEGGDTECA